MSTAPSHRQDPRLRGAPAAGFPRTLIYFPIIHTPEDLGSLKDPAVRAALEKVGRSGLVRRLAVIDQIWSDIERAIKALALDFNRVRLYQDGLPVCEREAEIVKTLAEAGNRNHQILLALMARGGNLMGTESSDLLVQEYQAARQALTTRPPRAAGLAAQRRTLSEALLKRRDEFIARRINETLQDGETGILFLGMLHSLEPYLARDIGVVYPLHRPG
jgi:hypothetical protein